jgi:hypothetical protein
MDWIHSSCLFYRLFAEEYHVHHCAHTLTTYPAIINIYTNTHTNTNTNTHTYTNTTTDPHVT